MSNLNPEQIARIEKLGVNLQNVPVAALEILYTMTDEELEYLAAMQRKYPSLDADFSYSRMPGGFVF